MNKPLIAILVVLVLIVIGVLIFSIYDTTITSNIKIIELEFEIKELENQLLVEHDINLELEKINLELLAIPDYLRDEYQKYHDSGDKFITAEEFLNEKTYMPIPAIFTAAIKGEISNNSAITVYGQVPYADSIVTGTIFRGNINNAAIIDIFQVTSNEYGQYSHDFTINTDYLWRVGEYTLSIQNEGVIKELVFLYEGIEN